MVGKITPKSPVQKLGSTSLSRSWDTADSNLEEHKAATKSSHNKSPNSSVGRHESRNNELTVITLWNL